MPIAISTTALEPVRAELAATPPSWAGAVAEAGRFAAVWLPIFVVLSAHVPAAAAALGTTTLAAGVFAIAQRGVLESIRLVRSALGRTASSFLGVAAGLLVVSALSRLVAPIDLHPLDLAVLGVCGFALSAGWDRLVARCETLPRRVLIVGTRYGGAELIHDLAVSGEEIRDQAYDVIGVIDDRPGVEAVAGVPVLGGLGDLAAVVHEHRPDIVILPAQRRRPRAFLALLEAADAGFSVVELPEFYEQLFARVPVRAVSAAWFMSVIHVYRRPYARATKRTFDLVVACVALVVTAPLWPVLALLVRTTPGPVFFRQIRLGEGGRTFAMRKFRTMYTGAEAGSAVWAAERDPRVTRVGAFLRRTRLDELPQLINVLHGEMSIVGPRPERPEFLDTLRESVPFWTHRHLVKPGITGWAQVCRGYTADIDGTADKLSYDLWYLRHRSLLVDVAICARTTLTLVSGFGAR